MENCLKNKAVIFDLDGVLVSSEKCHYRAWKEIADRLGIKFDRKKNDLLRGVSRRHSLQILLEGQLEISEDEAIKLMDEKNSAYLKLIMEKGEKLRMPGIIKLLEKLKKSGMKTALASGSGNARKIMTAAKIPENRFDAIITGKDFKNSKPHPESFLKAAAEINVPPRACLVVEDAPAGIEAAREAGMGTFGIGTAQLGPCDITQKKLNSKSDWLIFEYFQQKSRLSRSSET